MDRDHWSSSSLESTVSLGLRSDYFIEATLRNFAVWYILDLRFISSCISMNLPSDGSSVSYIFYSLRKLQIVKWDFSRDYSFGSAFGDAYLYGLSGWYSYSCLTFSAFSGI